MWKLERASGKEANGEGSNTPIDKRPGEFLNFWSCMYAFRKKRGPQKIVDDSFGNDPKSVRNPSKSMKNQMGNPPIGW